jgi:hypothetical protein
MLCIKNIAENRYQKSEMCQISGSRQTAGSQVCHMFPVQFLLNATCSLLNNSEGVA